MSTGLLYLTCKKTYSKYQSIKKNESKAQKAAEIKCKWTYLRLNPAIKRKLFPLFFKWSSLTTTEDLQSPIDPYLIKVNKAQPYYIITRSITNYSEHFCYRYPPTCIRIFLVRFLFMHASSIFALFWSVRHDLPLTAPSKRNALAIDFVSRICPNRENFRQIQRNFNYSKGCHV